MAVESPRLSGCMTRHVHVATTRTPVAGLRRLMQENGIGCVPVLEDGAVVGVVLKKRLQGAPLDVLAGSLMTSPGPSMAPETSCVEAARELQRSGLDHLLVVDAEGRLEGIVSSVDLLRRFFEARPR